MAQLPMRITVIWISSLVFSIFLESCHAQKMNIQWGPQSMMYLKGKHGKRYLVGDEEGVLRQGPEGHYGTVRGYHKLRTFKLSKPSEILCSENIFIQYLHDRFKKDTVN